MTGARARSILVGLLAAAWAGPALAAEPGPEPARVLLGGTPLVLKDGRMADVSVHTLPFGAGAEALAPGEAADLAALARELATDCFLTAQALGHVEPGAAGEGDTLAAHRLARARADGVQRALAERGLPANAVASVWDWQFMVREPRVTLWVFRLRQGEDCAGEPLPAAKAPAAVAERGGKPEGEPAAKVAAAAAPAVPRAKPSAPGRATVVAAQPKGGDGARPARAADPAATVMPAAGAPAAGEAGATSGVATAEAPPSPPSPPRVTDPEPASARQEPTSTPTVATADEARPGPTAADVPESAPTTPAPAAAVVATAAPAASAAAAVSPATADDGLEIVFETNSSYFPRGAGRALQGLLEGLPRGGGGYAFDLTATIDPTDVRTTDPTEAARYDRWLAERRLARVAEYLEKNAPGRGEVSVRRGLAEGDPSRRVIVRARALR